MYKVVHDMVPQYIKDLFQLRADAVPDIITICLENLLISLFNNSLSYSGLVIWNTIPSDIKNSSSIIILLGT